ncbi:hypothetical protein P7L54_07765 [Acinetobacter bereziniae]|uniref:hypothetical protein n=1 Tax=Acinetobacter bereziniae TaxID=106648 RepID=UPI0019058336|nr:hypothetical protein [Acinetobacter bereziniae]MDG3555848.1 hypothetical protein [Acinetobacter bereziniae]MDP5999799.1 hypothetical protein [Acinetobacter bereziniae]QQC81233.1 hypothetical protein I9192_03760 [Acinetobacter bereziniae]UUN94338.1 hypothetical protein I9189_003760 [Acinetobacter bereziniae]WMW75403.1 hypothetical protein RG306_03755 [Acinetobacter bereziniae]
MKNETPKEIKYSQINIGDKFQAKAYIYLTRAISHIANLGHKSEFAWLISYKTIPDESHSAFAHQEYALFNPELNYIQDGFIFSNGKRIAIEITAYIPIYNTETLMDWRNTQGHYKLEKSFILPLGVIKTVINYAEYAQDHHDYIHLGYTLNKNPQHNSPCIGVNGYLFNLITHCMRADARKYSIQGQDSIALHLRAIKRLNQAVKAHAENGGLF